MKKVDYIEERVPFKNLDTEEVKRILPHRHPMLMIDRVLEVTPGVDENGNPVLLGTSVIAEKEIKASEPSLEGHFPGRPVFPGVLMIEAMAQSTAFAFVQEIDQLLKNEHKDKSLELFLISIEDSKFKKIVTPGDTLEIRSKLCKVRGNFVFFECEAFVESKLVANATLRNFIGL